MTGINLPAPSSGPRSGTPRPDTSVVPQRRGRASDLNIRSYLDLSTAHLRAETRADLDAYEDVVAYRTEYGWLVYASEDPEGEWPSELVPIVRLAREHGCEYVLFDADATVADRLPTFDAQ
ncbi:hypothetical protein ABTY61_22815 [Kitasatospora sp. NPDC096128]|uniref:DUF5983 family protein n=1 Tax=Kitasatospora sp. NPDC096128 TaxID=3155547 RepID=UPI00331AD02B